MYGGVIDWLRTLPISSWVVLTSHVIVSVVRNVVAAAPTLGAAGVYQHPEEAEVHQAWVDGLAVAVQDGEGRAYVNFLGDEGEARIRQAYPGAKRPHQPLPPQPEHPIDRGVTSTRSRR
jgi:hypothetical protein